mmetsp:Transcript_19724/g.75757  ORF Transcript_19724/g.75757 Transcript_19724/m.75757 type:complete len:227 (+) Transcript_19724:614-1294(+)
MRSFARLRTASSAHARHRRTFSGDSPPRRRQTCSWSSTYADAMRWMPLSRQPGAGPQSRGWETPSRAGTGAPAPSEARRRPLAAPSSRCALVASAGGAMRRASDVSRAIANRDTAAKFITSSGTAPSVLKNQNVASSSSSASQESPCAASTWSSLPPAPLAPGASSMSSLSSGSQGQNSRSVKPNIDAQSAAAASSRGARTTLFHAWRAMPSPAAWIAGTEEPRER